MNPFRRENLDAVMPGAVRYKETPKHIQGNAIRVGELTVAMTITTP